MLSRKFTHICNFLFSLDRINRQRFRKELVVWDNCCNILILLQGWWNYPKVFTLLSGWTIVIDLWHKEDDIFLLFRDNILPITMGLLSGFERYSFGMKKTVNKRTNGNDANQCVIFYVQVILSFQLFKNNNSYSSMWIH